MGLFSRGESRAERRDREYHQFQSERLAADFQQLHDAMDERDARRADATERHNRTRKGR